MTHAAFEGLSETETVRLVRLHRLDPVTAEMELSRLRAEKARHVADTERRHASEQRDARRRLEMKAPELSAADHAAIRKVMVEQGLSPMEAAVSVGQARIAAAKKQAS